MYFGVFRCFKCISVYFGVYTDRYENAQCILYFRSLVKSKSIPGQLQGFRRQEDCEVVIVLNDVEACSVSVKLQGDVSHPI